MSLSEQLSRLTDIASYTGRLFSVAIWAVYMVYLSSVSMLNIYTRSLFAFATRASNTSYLFDSATADSGSRWLVASERCPIETT